MAEQQPGLRFDIYERVHVHEGNSAISELNEVELIPHIQVLTQDEQAVLKGNLLLTGSYVDESGEGTRSLEHFIPVEITLPLNRISRVEDIVVEIENFDIDLLSPRSLNVTGVLSLQGVEMISSTQDTWREEEEVVFVHEPDQPQLEADSNESIERIEAAGETTFAAVQPQFQLVEEKLEVSVDDSAELAELHEIDDKKDLKLAFGKKADEAIEVKSYGIKSLLSKASSIFHSDKRKEEEAALAAEAEASKGEPVEWQKLFLQSEAETQDFRKVRMCIVQREETLEGIAKRYQLSPRELQLFNRLGDQDISPGQIIYLPK
ncbi:LysM peptidoglycan-binding domain-containing protein [Paenibacillus sp. GP183]|uniref:LysM peptidoglycan-binding domain-containing protein n=1 Tax=Paenibacillus sp. GP183 TaxID=1882751 RepID=UPI0008957A95|nr:LysM peptidoglycan-binding domain-containing protein [Paenibacillus sp. GP183]SEC72052.1 stage VI sporulation protein D [Paenibacillus sp. GP183]